MTAGLPRASLLEYARFALTYALPSLLRGALIPQPFWTELTIRLNTGQWAVATVERLSGRTWRPFPAAPRRPRGDAPDPGDGGRSPRP